MNDKNLKYKCSECGFIWITLNGEHTICPKCHSEKIELLEEVSNLGIEKILNYNKSKGGCCGSAKGKGPLTCGKVKPDHELPNHNHQSGKCCGYE